MAKVKKVKGAEQPSGSGSSTEHVATNPSKRNPKPAAKPKVAPKKALPVATDSSSSDDDESILPKVPAQKGQPPKSNAGLSSSSDSDDDPFASSAVESDEESSDDEGETPVQPKKKQGMAKKADIVFPPLKILQKLKEKRVADVIRKGE